MTDDLFIQTIEQRDPRLGRQVVHDPRSRQFPMRVTIDKSLWHDKAVRIYDPLPNPNQTIGNCTGCAKMTQFNAVGNRVKGKVLNMQDATNVYSIATTIDPWAGSWPPDDTGSSGLAAAKAAQRLGLGGEYRWLFGGADEVVQSVMDGHVVNVGTRWDYDMFELGPGGVITPGGGSAGGHEWSVRGYNVGDDLVLGRCWWGSFRDFWIRRTDLDNLLRDNGDANVQKRLV